MSLAFNITPESVASPSKSAKSLAESAKPLTVTEACSLYEALESLERTAFALGSQWCFARGADRDNFNAPGQEIENWRNQIGKRMDEVLEQIRAMKPRDTLEQWRRNVTLVRFEAENAPGLLDTIVRTIRQERQDLI